MGIVRANLAAALLVAMVGCQQAAEPQHDDAQAAASVVEILPPDGPVPIAELSPAGFRPRVANIKDFKQGLRFLLADGSLPPGCQLEESTGRLQWTPDETQGPGRYELAFHCRPEGEDVEAVTYALTLDVQEVNAPPELDVPAELSVAAGTALEQTLGVTDRDFPANQITFELQNGPPGAVVDDLGRLLYWEIPEDWQEPRVELTVVARDNGTPPLADSRTVIVNVTDIVTPQPQMPGDPASLDRIPELAVELPDLPRPGEPIVPTTLELSLEPPVAPEDVRLSLMLPHEVRDVLKIRYVDDDDRRLAVLLATPFEADAVDGNLSDGIVATCELSDAGCVWTWTMTKDLTARAYQNNIRQGVLTIESRGAAPPRLVALHQSVDVPAPTLDALLGNEELQSTLMRRDRVKSITALEGLSCTVRSGNWTAKLDPQIDGFSLLLGSPRLTQKVNSGRCGIRFERFAFRVLPLSKEIVISLDAHPSPVDTYKQMRGARKSLARKQSDARRWQRKLAVARGQLSSAQSMPTRTPTQRVAKNTKINQATRAINQAEARLSQLAIQIPADQNLVATMEKKWQNIVTQLEPVRNCTVSGELWRRIGDVRVPVVRLIPVGENVADK